MSKDKDNSLKRRCEKSSYDYFVNKIIFVYRQMESTGH